MMMQHVLVDGAAMMMQAMQHVLDDVLLIARERPIAASFLLSAGTHVLTLVLELCCLSTVKGVLRQPGGRQLYAQALALQFFNNSVLLPFSYWFGAAFLCRERTPLLTSISSAAGLVLTQAIGYWWLHRKMHERRWWWMHRFHHRFKAFVPPSSANAVTPCEYVLAYAVPVVGGMAIFASDRLATFLAVAWMLIANLLVHTPPLERLAQRLLPWVFMTTHDHMEHHRKLTCFYASPTVSVDRLGVALGMLQS